MNAPAGSLVKGAAHLSRRLVGRAKLTTVKVDGVAPTAVVAALRSATVGLPSREEKAWTERVELMRQLLLRSSAPLEIVDFGAGAGHKFDTGATDVRNIVVKTLGAMTKSSKPRPWAYLLFCLVRELKPDSVVEMGACVGISAAYQGAALALNGSGRLITLEGAEVLAERSTKTLTELELAEVASVRLGKFADTLPDVIAELAPVGFAFIDGHHMEQATLDYMEQLLPSMAPESAFVFDDIRWSDGMRAAWTAIAADPRFALTVDLGSVGIAVLSASAGGRQELSVSFG